MRCPCCGHPTKPVPGAGSQNLDRFCGECGLVLPAAYVREVGRCPAVVVPIMGARGHGKTMLILALVSRLYRLADTPEGLPNAERDTRRTVLEIIRHASWLREDLKGIRLNPPRLPLASPGAAQEAVWLRVAFLRGVPECYLIIRDVGGEVFENTGAMLREARFVARAPAAIWVVGVSDDLSADHLRKLLQVYAATVKAAGGDPREKMLVVCLTKADEPASPELPPEALDFLNDSEAGVAGPRPAALSRQLKEWLRATHPMGQVLDEADRTVGRVEVTVVSSIGLDNQVRRAEESPGGDTLAGPLAPSRVLAPFRWLMRSYERQAMVRRLGRRTVAVAAAALLALGLKSGFDAYRRAGARAAYVRAHLADALEAGGTVRLGPGEYRLGRAADCRRPVTIRGGGPERTTIVGSDGPALIRVAVDGQMVLSDVTIDYQGPQPGWAVVVERAELDIRRCEFRGGETETVGARLGGGVRLGGATFGTVSECLFTASVDGLVVADEAQPAVTGCRVFGNQRAGLVVGGTARPTVIGLEAVSNGLHGISVRDQARPVLQKVRAAGNLQTAVAVWDAATPRLTESRIEGNARNGISINDGAQPVLSDLQVRRNGSVGLAFHNHAAGMATNVVCVDNRVAGILIAGSAAPTLTTCTAQANALDGLACQDSASGRVEQLLSADNRRYGARIADQASTTLIDCRFEANRVGVAVMGAAAPALLRNIARKSKGQGVLVQDLARPELRQNRVAKNEGGGLRFVGDCRGLLEGNVVAWNRSTGLVVVKPARPVTARNSMYCNRGWVKTGNEIDWRKSGGP